MHSALMVGVAQNTRRLNQHTDLGYFDGAMRAVFDSFSNRDNFPCLQSTIDELLYVGGAVGLMQVGIF